MVANPELYRRLIDELVRECLEGQGQIGPERARAGVWHPYATSNSLEDQYAINQLLTRLDAPSREVIAGMLAHAFESGVFIALRVLYDNDVAPFDDGYEGTPYNDFMGRISGDWDWPNA